MFNTNILQTYIESDRLLNMVLIGKTMNKNGIIEPLHIESAHIISCCLKLGNKSIDNYGKDITEEVWFKCDYNDRKHVTSQIGESFLVEKFGVGFHFQANTSDGKIYLVSISYRIEIFPKILSRKPIPIHLFGELA